MSERRRIQSERLSTAVSHNLAIGALALGVVAAYSGQQTKDHVEYYPLPPLDNNQTSQGDITSLLKYDNEDGELTLVTNSLPPAYSSAFQDGLSHPIVHYASQQNAFDTFEVIADRTENPRSVPPKDSAYFQRLAFLPGISDGKYIVFEIGDTSWTERDRVFTNSHIVKVSILHEAVHGLSYEWWKTLKNNSDEYRNDQEKKLFDELKRACTPVAIDLYTRLANPLPFISNDLSKDPNIASCNPQLFFMLEDMDAGEQLFRCVDEGWVQQDLFDLPEPTRGGHPYDNATELASSVVTALAYAPLYMRRCLSEMQDGESELVKDYIRATLNVVFHFHPQLDALLRQNPHSSRALDDVLDVDTW